MVPLTRYIYRLYGTIHGYTGLYETDLSSYCLKEALYGSFRTLLVHQKSQMFTIAPAGLRPKLWKKRIHAIHV
jgi:hypothetical protein